MDNVNRLEPSNLEDVVACAPCQPVEGLPLASGEVAVFLKTDELEALWDQSDLSRDRLGFHPLAISKTFCNRISREVTRLVFGAGGEFAWLWHIGAGGVVPFMHRHMDQTERIRVLHGEVQVVIAGVTQRVRAGEELVIPAGCDHLPFNAGALAALAIVEFDPVLDAAPLSARYWRMVHDGHIDRRRGRPIWWRLLRASHGLRTRTFVADRPEWAQRLVLCLAKLLQR